MNFAFREFCQRASTARNLAARKPSEVRGLSVTIQSGDNTWPEQVTVDEWLKYRTAPGTVKVRGPGPVLSLESG